MNKKDAINEWLKTNIELHNMLDELKSLDTEREKIKSLVESNNSETDKNLVEMMDNSIKSYEELLSKVKELKQNSIKLKNIIIGE